MVPGQSHYLVLNPTNREITHIMVGDDVSISDREYLVPIDQIVEGTLESIRLNCSREALAKLPVFKQEEFIMSDSNGINGSFTMLWPYATPEANYLTFENEHIPR